MNKFNENLGNILFEIIWLQKHESMKWIEFFFFTSFFLLIKNIYLVFC